MDGRIALQSPCPCGPGLAGSQRIAQRAIIRGIRDRSVWDQKRAEEGQFLYPSQRAGCESCDCSGEGGQMREKICEERKGASRGDADPEVEG